MASSFAALMIESDTDEEETTELESKQEEHVAGAVVRDGAWKPRGLVSIRNTCFVNCVMQAMIGCVRVRSLLSELHQKENQLKEEAPICSCLAAFTQQMTQTATDRKNKADINLMQFQEISRPGKRKKNRGRANKKSLNTGRTCTVGIPAKWLADSILPSSLDLAVEMFSKHAIGQHEDAHEFFHYLCERAHEELETYQRTRVASGVDADARNGGAVGGSGDWHEIGTKNRKKAVTAEAQFSESLFSRVFGGRFKTELHKRGTSDSLQYAPFFSVSLNAEAVNVDAALKDFASPEKIQGLRHQSREIDADSIARFDAVPDVLVLHFKRFYFSNSGSGKIDKHMGFRQKFHIPSPCLTASLRKRGSPEYTLRAVVVHRGKSASHGHFITYVLHHEHGWLSFNDVEVQQVSWDSVVSQEQAYLLFYEKATPPS